MIRGEAFFFVSDDLVIWKFADFIWKVWIHQWLQKKKSLKFTLPQEGSPAEVPCSINLTATEI